MSRERFLDDVPLNSGGTAIIQAVAIPNSSNGGQGTGTEALVVATNSMADATYLGERGWGSFTLPHGPAMRAQLSLTRPAVASRRRIIPNASMHGPSARRSDSATQAGHPHPPLCS